jgi:hypothetical protein
MKYPTSTRGQFPRALERQAARQVARHPVVAEGREHADAGLVGRGAVALEHLADERRLASRVDVVGARRGGRGGRGRTPAREWADRGHEHVPGLDDGPHAGRIRDVGRRRLQPAAELLHERVQLVLAASREHGLQPALDHRLRR